MGLELVTPRLRVACSTDRAGTPPSDGVFSTVIVMGVNVTVCICQSSPNGTKWQGGNRWKLRKEKVGVEVADMPPIPLLARHPGLEKSTPLPLSAKPTGMSPDGHFLRSEH